MRGKEGQFRDEQGKARQGRTSKFDKNNTELNHRLMSECDIYFLEQEQDTEFQGHGEIFSMEGEVFARDGSGGEFLSLRMEALAL